MSTRTERLAAIDRLIDYLAQERIWFPEPGANWESLLEFADLTEEETDQARITLDACVALNPGRRIRISIEAGEMPISIKEAVRQQLAGLPQRQAARDEKRRVKNRQALAKRRVPPEQRVDGRVKTIDINFGGQAWVVEVKP